MRLSTRATYGMRLCFMLALSKTPLSASQLVRQTDVGIKYLEQLLAMLKRGEIVNAYRGKTGGAAAHYSGRYACRARRRIRRTCVRVGELRGYLLPQSQRAQQTQRRNKQRARQRYFARHCQRLPQ